MPHPAYRIRTPRLLLKCWDPAEAPLVHAAIDASLPHLLRWIPWAKNEPTTVDDKVELLRGFRGRFDLGQDFTYAIFPHDLSTVLGGTGLHPRIGPRALEIGYWIHVDHVGQGLATEAASALTRVAFEVHEVDRIEIHCDPANVASAAIPDKLGYNHDATLRRRAATPDGELRDTMIWSLYRDEYSKCPARTVDLEVLDAAGRAMALRA